MQYATLGRTGLQVSRLAFGAMTFTAGNSDMAAVYKVGAEAADHLVGQALDAGVNFFDTADGYANGESETLLGAALKAHRDEVVIATKVGFRTGPALGQAGLSRRHILWSVEQSLRRLGTDRIDVYIAHKEDPFTPLEETLRRSMPWPARAKCATSASPIGRPGRWRQRWRSSAPAASRPSHMGRCTTRWSGATWSATWCR
jgi:aryl-alcohol dehydrogenase-like predicted oxidoreductase